MGKRVWACLGVLMAGSFLASCSQKDPYEEMADCLAQIVLPLDDAGYAYMEALDAVGSYIDGESDRSGAESVLWEKVDALETMEEAFKAYEEPENLDGLLAGCGIKGEEFRAFISSCPETAAQYVFDLEILGYYLEYSGEDPEGLKSSYALQRNIMETEKAYYYYGCINYWCAEWPEEGVAHVREKVIEPLKAYGSDEFGWVTDQPAAEAMAGAALDEIEVYVEELEEEIAFVEEELYRMME